MPTLKEIADYLAQNPQADYEEIALHFDCPEPAAELSGRVDLVRKRATQAVMQQENSITSSQEDLT